MDEGKYTIHNEGLIQGPIIGDHNIINQNFYNTGTDIPRTPTTEASDRLILLEHAKDPDRDRLFETRSASFVLGTRQNELNQITMLIRQLKTSGGYLTITGKAGEGKTTLVTQLIETEFGRGQTAYHILPLNPPHDHQVTLLRSIMAILALKHSYLPDHWTQVFHRDTLAGIFSNMLFKIAEQGDEEVIFIDGLDQIKPDSSDQRDLDFFPLSLPTGIVIVISARPDDTFNSLALRSPLYEYKLPRLGRADAFRILTHYKVDLAEDIIDRLYLVTQQNAMYIALVAKELSHLTPNRNVEKILDSVSNNPDNIFAISIERLKQPKTEWRTVIKPLLGLVLAAQEHLSIYAMGKILGIDEETVLEGLQRLEGLVEKDAEGKYALYHLKLQEYLKDDRSNSVKGARISLQEERLRHKQISDWCALNDVTGGEIIWQATSDIAEQERRNYARNYYITHLYYANEWQQIFTVLDSVKYGRAKLNYPSIRSFAHDLDLGLRSAAWTGWTLEKGVDLLPRLWQYTFLRCRSRSRADQYPLEAFRLLLLLNRKQEAIGLAESLTNPTYQVKIMGFIANLLKQQSNQNRDWFDLFTRAQEIAVTIEDSKLRANALTSLIHALIQAKQWELAKELIMGISNSYKPVYYHDEYEYYPRTIEKDHIQAVELIDLGDALARAQQEEQALAVWKEAVVAISKIKSSNLRVKTLKYLVNTLNKRGLWERADDLWQEVESIIPTTEEFDMFAWPILGELSGHLVSSRQWERAEAIISFIEDRCVFPGKKKIVAQAMADLGLALARAQEWERAKAVIRDIERLGPHNSQEVSDFNSAQQARALAGLAVFLTEKQQSEQAEALWQEAEAIIYTVKDYKRQAEALIQLGGFLRLVRRLERAKIIWQKAEEIIIHSKDGFDKSMLLINLSGALVRGQQYERAEAIFDNIEERYKNSSLERFISSLIQLSYDFIGAKKWDRAEAIIRTIKSRHKRSKTLSDLGIELARAHEWDRAEAIIHSIEYITEQFRSSSYMINALIKIGNWDRAGTFIRSIKFNEVRAKALCQFGSALARGQRQEQAMLIWQEAEAILSTNKFNLDNDDIDLISSEDSDLQYSKIYRDTLNELGSALIGTLQQEQTTTSWQEIETFLRSIKDDQIEKELTIAFVNAQQHPKSVNMQRAIASTNLDDLASALVWLSREEQVETLGPFITTVIHSIKNNKVRAKALIELGSALMQIKQQELATTAWQEAETFIQTIEDDQIERELRNALASAQQNHPKTTIHTIKETVQRARTLVQLGNEIAERGSYDKLLYLIQRSWLIVKGQEEALILFRLVIPLIKTKQKLALDLYDAFTWVDTFLRGE